MVRTDGSQPAVRVITAFLVATGACLMTACSTSPPAASPPLVVNRGVDCSSYGGCDVLEDYSDGTSRIVPIQARRFFDANVRARQDSLLPNVLDTAVVGHNAPHVALSNLYRNGQAAAL
jgi:hypothetical protein